MQNYQHPFVKHVKKECKRYGCKVKLIHNPIIVDEDKNSFSGYFLDVPLELVVATRCHFTYFLSTLVHEFSHFEQWKEKSPYFINGKRHIDSWDITNRWIAGEDFTRRTIKKCINEVRNCELDCERRAVENIKKFNLPINIKSYCKKASAYIHFHNFMKRKRIWESKKNPTEIPKIVDMMPDNLDGDYSKTPRKIMRLYDKYLL